MKEINVLLVAVGGIGFRHFQALLKCKTDFAIHVVDISEEAIKRARAYADEQARKKDVYYYAGVRELEAETYFQVAIIATASLPRRVVFEELMSRCFVKTVIFEKVLFPRLQDYEEVGRILREKHVDAYVNCIRRVQNVYRQLREELKGASWLNVYVKGFDWKLGCNSIHMIDLAAYLTPWKTEDVSCNGFLLEDHIYESKRKGYVEFYGKLTGKIGKNTTYLMESTHREEPFVIELFTDEAYYCINETDGLLEMQSLNSGESIERRFQAALVSQTTICVVDDLLNGQRIDLTPYEESIRYHIPLLQEFLKKQNKLSGAEGEICLIT